MSISLDTKLIQRFREGEAAAFDVLVARHRQRVFNLIYRMIGDPDRAEDVTIDVFLEAYLSLSGFREESLFTSWLHRLTVNVCLEDIRRQKAKRHLPEESLECQQVASPGDLSDTVVNKELARRITSAMQFLPEGQRAAVVLFYVENLSCAEIARLLGIPRGTVKTRIFYGTRQLRDRLRADGILSSDLAAS
jgi:RNA polymerase sigma-70 factor (ECF subfamily)